MMASTGRRSPPACVVILLSTSAKHGGCNPFVQASGTAAATHQRAFPSCRGDRPAFNASPLLLQRPRLTPADGGPPKPLRNCSHDFVVPGAQARMPKMQFDVSGMTPENTIIR